MTFSIALYRVHISLQSHNLHMATLSHSNAESKSKARRYEHTHEKESTGETTVFKSSQSKKFESS